jgi:hypothetical protein
MVIAVVALVFPACTTIGPKSIPVDRFDYSTAIADSWKQQTLLNIVKLRYMDLPVFVDVASIVAGYSVQTGVAVNGVVSSTGAVQGNYVGVGGNAVYTDRPTITYVPLTGEKFLRGLMTPIDPKNIFFMLQTGYPADFILGLTVESLNGVRNRSTTGGVVRKADPEFVRALQLIRDVQSVGAIGMRVEEDKARGATGVVFFRRDDVTAETLEQSTEIRRLLRLSAESQRFTLTYSPVRGTDDELAVNSRSMLQIMSAFASYMDVPEAHLLDRSATPALEGAAGDDSRNSVRIHSGKDKPSSAFAAVHYRDHWFWIDNGDWATKRAMTAIMFFFTLAETGSNEALPLITIPAQ